MILIYAFSNQWGTNISRRVLSELHSLPFFKGRSGDLPAVAGAERDFIFEIIHFHPQAFFNKYIKNSRYDLIIGLGDYYGDIQKIRLETIAHNVYGKNTIAPFSPISLELSLPILDNLDTSKFSVTEHMGTYNCNWIAYQTQMYINDHSPNTKQLFFHLPKRGTPTPLAANITELLQNNILI